jgi:hypothetical protein
MEVTLRPAQSNDEPLLYALYASTRADEMQLVDWSPEQKEAFVRMQFEAQRQHYPRVFPDAEHSVILVDGTAAWSMRSAWWISASCRRTAIKGSGPGCSGNSWKRDNGQASPCACTP